MNRKNVSKLSNFILGNGFYIALTLCVALIVLSGYYLMNTLTPTIVAPVSGVPEIVVPEPKAEVSLPLPEVTAPVLSPEDMTEEPPEAQTETMIAPSPDPSLDNPEPSTDTQEESDSEPEAQTSGDGLVEDTTAMTPEPVAISYQWPAQGEVSRLHSLEVLSYHPVMGDWRTHQGIDITCAFGSPVMSVAEGEVVDVFAHDMTGTTVVIDHRNGVQSTYANLGEFPSVSTGDWVQAGQIIAVVGDSALAEKGSEPHLDFSMTENGEAKDPLAYLPEEQAEGQMEHKSDDLAH